MTLRQFGWGSMTFFAVAIGAYALAVLAGVVPNDFLSKFADYRLAANLHFLGGGFALLLGPWQFNERLRTRYLAGHRWIGRAYVVAVLAGAGAGVYMAPRADGGLAAASGFGLLGVLWILTVVLAWTAARSGDIPSHRRWMVRNFALTYAAVTLRVYLPLSQMAGYDFDESYQVIAWLCWVPNLIVADWLLLAEATRRRRSPAPLASSVEA